jgi:hypothetical protein
MQVFYRVPRRRRNGPTVYEATRVVFCCGEMERQWGRIVRFGGKDCRASTDCNVNLFLARPQAGGRCVTEMVRVAHCAWCGEAISPCRVK